MQLFQPSHGGDVFPAKDAPPEKTCFRVKILTGTSCCVSYLSASHTPHALIAPVEMWWKCVITTLPIQRNFTSFFPKMMTGNWTQLPAIPEGTPFYLPMQHLQVQRISNFPVRNNVKITTSVYTDICNHGDIFLTPYSHHIQLRWLT